MIDASIRRLAHALGCERRQVAEALSAAGLLTEPRPTIRPVTRGRPALLMPAAPAPKSRPVRSKKYRALVASLPCAHCGIEGASQCAHANRGKGLSLKVCDLQTFPLCHEFANGCHKLFDTYSLVEGGAHEHARIADIWVAQTQRQILDSGLWPASIPRPS